jgi:hypothetical protein
MFAAIFPLDKSDVFQYYKNMPKKARSTDSVTYQKPKRTFEKSGTVNPESSFYVPLENVVNTNNQDMKTMVDKGRYFSIFAPRQSGKTTFLEEFCSELHKDPTYIAIILCFQDYSNLDITGFYSEIEQDLYDQLMNRLRDIHFEKAETVSRFLESHHLTDHISFSTLFNELNRIIQHKKIAIFIDEFEGIPLRELENFLNTLRSLYHKYKIAREKSLYSVGLVGVRNITRLALTGVSPYNIADWIKFPSFSLKNVRELYRQYTEETNHPFTEEAVKKVFEETAGQPWLVNRLGTILTVNVKPETVEPIDEKDVEQAIQLLLRERNDHFNNLYEKAKLYKETFVEIVFYHVEYNQYDEEHSWLEEYGLIKNKNENAVVANNMYKARFLKTFFKEVKAYEDLSPQEYVLPGDRLDMKRILLNFEQYIAQIGVSAFYKEKKPYEKTGQFLLTAWLYQFVKSGEGDLRYEVRSGLGRMDVILTYKGIKYIIETKMNHRDDITRILEEGLTQVTQKYLATEAAGEGYLVIFDTKTHVGAACTPQVHKVGDYQVTSFTIAIGRPDD